MIKFSKRSSGKFLTIYLKLFRFFLVFICFCANKIVSASRKFSTSCSYSRIKVLKIRSHDFFFARLKFRFWRKSLTSQHFSVFRFMRIKMFGPKNSNNCFLLCSYKVIQFQRDFIKTHLTELCSELFFVCINLSFDI